MSATVTIQEAQARLTELIQELEPGEELVIIDDGNPVATLSRRVRTSWPSQPGTAEHTRHWMAGDFDAPLEDFKEYME